jgi:hypothetical protein
MEKKSYMTDRNLQALRLDLAERSFWNLGYFVAGLIFWLYVIAVNIYFPLEVAKIYWLVGTFFIFPIAVLVSRLLGADPFSKGNKLGELVGYTHMSVIALTFPLIIFSMIYFPEVMILILAIAYCLDFYVMTWAFGSPLFGIHAAVRVVIVTVIWFARPDWRVIVLPATVAFAYLITVILIPRLRRKWLAKHHD